MLAEDVKVGKTVIAKAGDELSDELAAAVIESGVLEARVRSVTTCEAEIGVCAACYGRSLASGRMVDIGEAVGIIAAQSIGEPGTQLTMRTFHTGGVAGEDITHGLPRVQELFEARKPKGEAQITELTGEVSIEDDDEKHVRRIRVTDDTGDMVEYPVSFRARLTVNTGDKVEVGQQLTEGSVNPHDILRVKGVLALQQHLADEVQLVYRSQGVTIHDKHIELIARQMLRKVHIIEPGDTDFLPGDLINRRVFEDRNGEIVESGGTPASARPVLLGITKASLATDSWLSAASFQETTKVLTDAAIGGKSDPLLGLKENVIIGKLIPAGTGMNRYRNVQVRIKPEAIPEYWLQRQRELADAAAEAAEGGSARRRRSRRWSGSRASRPSGCSAAARSKAASGRRAGRTRTNTVGALRPPTSFGSPPDPLGCTHRFRDQWQGGSMRSLGLIVGALLIVVGGVWTIQGYGTLKGSFMTGSHMWMWIESACVVAGVLILVASLFASRNRRVSKSRGSLSPARQTRAPESHQVSRAMFRFRARCSGSGGTGCPGRTCRLTSTSRS